MTKQEFGTNKPKAIWFLIDVGKGGKERIIEMSVTALDWQHLSELKSIYEAKKGFKKWIGLTEKRNAI